MSTLVPGFYGKLPSHGDFVRRRLSGSFVDLWDSWLQSAVAQSKEQLGANWLEIYLGSPLWRFIFTPGVCGPDMLAGVLMPSVDRAGRYFPLTMAVSLPEAVNPLRLATEYDDWFGRAESILLSALDDSVHFELDEFDRQVEACVLEFASPPSLPAGSEATVFPGQGKSWHIGIASVDHLGASLRHLHWKQLGGHFNPLSMWWTNGSEHVAPSALLSEGIPPAASYAAMLDGQWRTRHWPSIQLESVTRIAQRPIPAPGATAEIAQPAAAEQPAQPAASTPTEQPTPSAQAAEPAPEVPAVEAAAAPDAGPAAEPAVEEQPPAAPPHKEIIPEIDPMELIAPDETDTGVPDLEPPSAQPAGLANAQGTLPEPEPEPAIASAPPADIEDTLKQPIPEMDPLDMIDLASGSDTPLDPLEALGLTGGSEDLRVPVAPEGSAVAGGSEPPAEAVVPDAASPVDQRDSQTVPREPHEADITAPRQPAEPAATQPAVSGPVFFSASATHAGNDSDFNEDAVLERRDMALWAVADGGGGHWIGDVASQAVVSELETVAPAAGLGDLADDVKGKLSQAHTYLQKNLELDGQSSDESGAAVAVFAAAESRSACLSVGPVRIYRRRDGVLQNLTPESGPEGGLVGQSSELLVDSRFHKVEVGDWFLVCSRGLYEVLDDKQIEQGFSATSPEEVCERLLSEALSRGAKDNVSVVVVQAASPDES
jgi:type VI secretion system protein ImpM